MNGSESESPIVQGEREAAAVHRARGLHSRLNSVLAFGLMTALGLGALTWYYAHAFSRQDRVRQVAQAAASGRAQGELPLPSLGVIDPPQPPAPAAAPMAAALPALAEAPLPDGLGTDPSRAAAYGPPAAKSPAALVLERQLAGSVYAQQSIADGGAAAPEFGGAASAAAPAPRAPPAGDDLAALLRGTAATTVRAHVLPTLRLLLPKGAFIDCTLETAIDSTLPGLTTCVTATDTFGADGKVVLLERGTKLVGEVRGQVQLGMARVFVLWTEARTPNGVVVPLASPGTDELGRSGLTGSVNRHFWQRFGAAMLVSVIDGGVQAAVQSAHGGGGALVVNPSASQGVMTEVLKDTINIPPTIVKRQGDRIQVLVARDVDFRSVYELRIAATAR